MRPRGRNGDLAAESMRVPEMRSVSFQVAQRDDDRVSEEAMSPAIRRVDEGAEKHERRLTALDAFIAAYEVVHSEIAPRRPTRQRGDCGIGLVPQHRGAQHRELAAATRTELAAAHHLR